MILGTGTPRMSAYALADFSTSRTRTPIWATLLLPKPTGACAYVTYAPQPNPMIRQTMAVMACVGRGLMPILPRETVVPAVSQSPNGRVIRLRWQVYRGARCG